MSSTFIAVRNILNTPEHGIGKKFALTIQVLIIVSLISFSIDTLPNLSSTTKSVLDIIELVTVLIFTVEYLLRLTTSERKVSYLFSFYGIIDLIAILPFYLATTIDLRAVRIFRLLRLIRILKLLKYSRAINHFSAALKSIKEELILFGFMSAIMLYLSAVGIYYFEHQAQPELFQSVFHSLWWAVTTLTTVGYGDMYPITVGGRIFTFFVLMIGLGIVAVPTGLIASAMSKN
ncbi:ion transporter [Sessilibacter corallicola]|uniref:ion transporter n=1 Tax=Sessilibacter corallicola TaxID=2904075 RepID=UPI001E4D162A|nr:ion transporter [Sessilibacter corallicola]MCE2029309.1 ion transporter [Sessilibacter corallicola]